MPEGVEPISKKTTPSTDRHKASENLEDHFADVRKMIRLGKNQKQKIDEMEAKVTK